MAAVDSVVAEAASTAVLAAFAPVTEREASTADSEAAIAATHEGMADFTVGAAAIMAGTADTTAAGVTTDIAATTADSDTAIMDAASGTTATMAGHSVSDLAGGRGVTGHTGDMVTTLDTPTIAASRTAIIVTAGPVTELTMTRRIHQRTKPARHLTSNGTHLRLRLLPVTLTANGIVLAHPLQ
jgi:hypothetical protein